LVYKEFPPNLESSELISGGKKSRRGS
jgi:hypothetical protein